MTTIIKKQRQPPDSRLLVVLDQMIRHENSLSQMGDFLEQVNNILTKKRGSFFNIYTTLSDYGSIQIYVLTDKEIAKEIDCFLSTLPQVTRNITKNYTLNTKPRTVFVIGPSITPSLIIHLSIYYANTTSG